MERRRLGAARPRELGAHLRRGGARPRSTRTWPTRRSRRRSTPASTTSTWRPATATPSCGSAPWMPRIRDRGLPGHQDRASATRETPGRRSTRSLERLQTDHVDLLQLHAVGDLDELDRVTAPGRRARGRGPRAGGGPGRGRSASPGTATARPRPTSRRCAGFPFATVLTPLNVALWRDDDYRADYDALVAEVAAPGRRADDDQDGGPPQLARGRPTKRYATWYEPQSDPERIRAAVSWVLAHDEVTGLATPGDVRLLKHVVAAEKDRMSRRGGRAGARHGPGLRLAVRGDARRSLTESSVYRALTGDTGPALAELENAKQLTAELDG